MRQQRGDCGVIGLVDPSFRDQLVDQILDVLAAQGCKCTGWNVEELKLIGNVHAHVANKCATDFISMHLQQHLWTRRVQSFHELRGGVQSPVRCSDHDRIRLWLLCDKTNLEQRAQRVSQIVQFLRRRDTWDIEGSQSHAIKRTMVFRRFGGHQDLFLIERRPEGLGDSTGRPHGRVEVHIFDIEARPAASDRVVKRGHNPKVGGNFSEEPASIPAVVKVGTALLGSQFKLSRVRQHLGGSRYFWRPRTQRIA